MVIQHFGDGCFRLQSGEVSLLVDPVNARLKGDVVLKTLVPAAIAAWADNEIFFAGEYEMKGLEIRGWQVEEESTDTFLKVAYRVDWEEMSFAFLGHLSKPPPPELIDKIGEPDVVFLPAGGGHFLSPDQAAKVAKQFEPKLIIPGFFSSPKEVAKAFGQNLLPQDKLVFKKKDLAKEGGRVVALSSNS